ncbi:hypothetical protein, partial [Bergeriella denitrificans]|uniref:hypothetical protein n=1 Tax=Bergeriella denitrificans TaxID=494 RepID=UPI001C3FA0F2
ILQAAERSQSRKQGFDCAQPPVCRIKVSSYKSYGKAAGFPFFYDKGFPVPFERSTRAFLFRRHTGRKHTNKGVSPCPNLPTAAMP